MKRYHITLSGRTFDVCLLSDIFQEQVEVEVDGQPLTVQVRPMPEPEHELESSTSFAPARSQVTPPTPMQATTASSRVVTAPLPGVIKSIAVKPAQEVAKGDALLVIEAMKMDNVLRASRAGVIDAIHVQEGHQVSHGERLLQFRE